MAIPIVFSRVWPGSATTNLVGRQKTVVMPLRRLRALPALDARIQQAESISAEDD